MNRKHIRFFFDTVFCEDNMDSEIIYGNDEIPEFVEGCVCPYCGGPLYYDYANSEDFEWPYCPVCKEEVGQ